MTDLVSEVVINDRATAVLNRVAEAMDKTAAAEGRVAAGAEVVNQKVGSTRSIESAARAFEQLKRSADPAYDALTRLADQNTKLQRAVALGTATQAEANAVYAKLHEQANLTVSRLGGMTVAHADLAKATKFTYVETQILRSGLINTVQSLASGQSAMQVLQVQGLQTAPALGAVARSIGLTGTAALAIAAPIAAMTVGFGLAITRALSLESAARSVSVALTGMGKAGDLSVAQANAAIDRLVQGGSSRAEARAGITEVIRSPGQRVPAALAEGIFGAARDASAVLGTEATAEAKALTAAIGGGSAALEKYLLDRNAVNASELVAIRRAEQLGDRVGMTRIALDAMSNAMGGKYRESLSASATAVRDLAAAWDEFLNAGAATGVIQRILGAGTMVLDAATKLAQGKPLYDQKAMDAYLGFDQPAGAPGQLPGATNSFDPRGLALNTAELQRLSTVMDAAVKHLPQGYALLATSTVAGRPGTPGSDHPIGKGMDVQLVGPGGPIPNKGAIGSDPGMYERLAAAAYLENQRLFPGTPFFWGGRVETKAGSGMLDWMHFGATQDRGRFGPPLAEIAARYRPQSTPASAADAQPSTAAAGAVGASVEGVNLLTKFNEEIARQKPLWGLVGVAQEAARAQTEKYQEIILKTGDAENARLAGQAASNAVYERTRAEFEKQADTANRVNSAQQGVVQGFAQSQAAGLQAQAGVEAYTIVLGKYGDVAGRSAEIEQLRSQNLAKGATDAALAAAKTLPGILQQTEAQQRLAAAELQGAGAVQEAERVEKIRAQTRDLSAAAGATQDQATLTRIGTQIAAINQLSRADQAAGNSRAANALQFRQQQDLTVALAQKQIALETDPARVQAGGLAVQHLQDEFAIRQQLKGAEESSIQNALRNADAIRQVTAETQALNSIRDKAKSIADDIGQFFVDSFVNIDKAGKSVFSNLMDAVSAGFKRLVANIAVDFLKQQLIMPITTAIVGAAPSLFGIASSSGSSGGSSILSLGNISSAASLGRSTGLFGDLGLGDIAGSINRFGASNLGFATPTVGLSESSIASLGNMIGIESSSLSYLGNASSISGSGLFGGTTLTGFAGSPGSGIAAGNLLENLA